MSVELTRTERLLLANQYLILESIGPEDERESFARFREALEQGFEAEYETIAQNVYPDGLTKEQCHEVINALHVCDMLRISYERLNATDKAAIKKYDIEFHGFDGNNETSFMTYAEFVCGDGRRFADVTASKDFNSHSPSRGRYRAMHAELQEIPSDRWGNMTKEEIQRIAAAR